MTPLAFFLIVFSAGLHASWNLLAKRSSMSITFYAVLGLFSALLWQHVWFWTPVKVFTLPPLFWVYLSCVMVSEFLYCNWLVRTYRSLELSTAYPMMRALPLIIIPIVTWIAGWGKPLSGFAILGMLVVFIGCLLMPQKKFSDFHLKDYFNKHMFFVLMVACGISGCTIFDSQAQSVLREAYPDVAKPVVSLSYYCCRGALLTLLLFITVLSIPQERKNLAEFIRQRNWIPALAGVFSSLAYSSVLLAMNYVTNVTYVQIFRQLGLVIGVAGGIFILKERAAAPKIAGVTLILLGLAISVL